MTFRVLVLVALLAFLGGCGDDDDGGSGQGASGDATLSRSEVIARGDEFCRQLRETRDREANAAEGAAPEAQGRALHTIADAAEHTADQFDALEVPAADRDVIRNYVAMAREQLVLIRRAADSLEQGDAAEANTLLQSGSKTAAQLRRIARGYGFKVCGSADQ